MKYRNLSDVLDALADDRCVARADVPARLLSAKIYVYGSGMPGCLYDYGPHYARTRRAAIDALAFVSDDGCGAPRGLVSALRAGYSFQDSRGIVYEVSRTTLGAVL